MKVRACVRFFPLLLAGAAALAAAPLVLSAVVGAQEDGRGDAAVVDAVTGPDSLARGEYLFHAGACDSCHTDHPGDGAFLAGGRSLQTAFGTFYMPNITPDPETGIGAWSFEDFVRSMVEGLSPEGEHYYPAFPYRWYTGMTAGDLADLWTYLQTVPPVRNPVPPHELKWPFKYRFLVLGWKLLNFDQGETVFDPERPEAWNRGAYLVNHLGHCGACHTTKVLGNFLDWKFLAGAGDIPGPYPAPNITPDPVTGIGDWSREDVVRALKRSMTPDGTPIRGPMAEYVSSGSSYLSEEDLEAVAVYLETVEPEVGPVGEAEERRDRRLDMKDQGDGGAAGGEAPNTGSIGSNLLILSKGGRTLAK